MSDIHPSGKPSRCRRALQRGGRPRIFIPTTHYGRGAMPDDRWIQYGSFGVLVLMVVWTLWKGIPNVLSIHQTTVEGITKTFQARSESSEIAFKSVTAAMLASAKEESKACRDEREARERAWAQEREADRKSRHDQSNLIQRLVLRLEDIADMRQQEEQQPPSPPKSGRIPRLSRGPDGGEQPADSGG